MTKILGIVGSPRRNGNTHILVSTILKGAQERGAETDLLFLGDLDIKECDGCYACWTSESCTKNDDMNDLYPKIIASDIIIFGTPVYWYGPTALMKAFIDRLVYFNCPENRKKIENKSAVVAIPFEEEKLETADLLLAFFDKCFQYLQMNFAAKIVVPGVTKKGEIQQHPERLNEAYELGRSLVR